MKRTQFKIGDTFYYKETTIFTKEDIFELVLIKNKKYVLRKHQDYPMTKKELILYFTPTWKTKLKHLIKE